MDYNNNQYTSNEWYNIIQSWRNQKYYAPTPLNSTSQSTSISIFSPLVSGALNILSDDSKNNNSNNLLKDDNIVDTSLGRDITTVEPQFEKDQQQQQQQQLDTSQQVLPQQDNQDPQDLQNQQQTQQTQDSQQISSTQSTSTTSAVTTTPLINQSTATQSTSSSLQQPSTSTTTPSLQQQQQQQQQPQSDTSSASFIIIENLLKSLKNEKDDILRINLLLFLQENSSILLEDDSKRLERVVSILQSLIVSQTDTFPVKSQVLTTITTILICESIIKTNPKLIEMFIEILMEIISKINNSPDRLLRGSACNCLLEFELTYPCILSEYRLMITNYCQQESTHLVQNYTVLLSTILQNVTLNTYEEASSQQQNANTIINSTNNNNNNSNNNQNLSLNAISSPTTNTLIMPISPSTPQFNQLNSQLQLLQQQQQQQQQKSYMSSQSSHSSSNNLLSLTSPNSAQSSLNYASSRKSALLPLPNSIFSDMENQNLRGTSTFIIPANVKYSPISLEKINNEMIIRHLSNVKLSDAFEKDVFKCASIIADQSAYLNQWGLLTCIQQLVPLIDLVNIPHNFFKNHLHLLYKFFFTNNSVQFHLILYLTLTFQDIYSQAELDYCLKHIIGIINDNTISLENRVLTIDWFLSLPQKLNKSILINPLSSSSSSSSSFIQQQQQQPSGLLPISIFQFYSNFYPTSFDSIQLKEAKLYTLCKCLIASPTNLNIQPEELLKSLICLDEFKHNNETAPSTRIVFSCLLMFLSNFSNLMFSCIEVFLSETLINYPQFLNVIIGLLNGVHNNKIKINLFLSLSKTIVLLKPLRFLQYLPLVERVIVEDQIDPTGLLEKTFDLVRRKKICTSGNWFIGNIILSICRRAIMYHHTTIVAKPLKLILSNLSSYFSNLEIRDRASFYQRLISHLPDDKIKIILNTQQNDEANVSGLLSAPLASDKAKLIKSVPNFISISQINREISNSIQPLSVFEPVLSNDSSENNSDIEFNNYLALIRDSNKIEAKIIIPYQIRYKNHINSGSNVNISSSSSINGGVNSSISSGINNGSSRDLSNFNSNGIPLKVYALLIQLQQSPYYSPINPIRIPYLCYPSLADFDNSNSNNNDINDNDNDSNSNKDNDNSNNNTENSENNGDDNSNNSKNNFENRLKEFPYCYNVDLSFKPICPIPTTFSIKMIFNDDEGKTCKSDGSVISIQLSNLFMKTPLPSNINSNSESDSNRFRLNLFNKFWSLSLPSVIAPTNNYQVQITNSVKQINISSKEIKEILNFELSNYILNQDNEMNIQQNNNDNNNNNNNNHDSSSNNNQEIKEIIKVLIFLPPQYHLLLQFEISKDSTIVYIKTDYWRCLVYLDQYLSNLSTKIITNNKND